MYGGRDNVLSTRDFETVTALLCARYVVLSFVARDLERVTVLLSVKYVVLLLVVGGMFATYSMYTTYRVPEPLYVLHVRLD